MYIDTFSEIQFLKTQFFRKLSMFFDENLQIKISENMNNNFLEKFNFYTYKEGRFIKQTYELDFITFAKKSHINENSTNVSMQYAESGKISCKYK